MAPSRHSGPARSAFALMISICALVFGAHAAHAAGIVGNGTPDSCTEAALDAALAGGGSVTFNCGTSPVTITVSPKSIGANTSLDGGGLVTLSGGGFGVNAGVTLDLHSVTISGGNGYDNTRNLHGGTLTVTDSTFSGNSANLFGGGAIWNQGTLTVTNCTFSGNSAPYGRGGAIWNEDTLTVTNSTFSGNSGRASGGAIWNESGLALNVTNSTFSDNSAGSGGAIQGGTLTVTNSTFSGNSAPYGGGAISADILTVTNSTFSGNSGGAGGAIQNAGTAILTNITFSDNSAPQFCVPGTVCTGRNGGAIENDGTLTVTNCTFSGNSATGVGGAIVNGGTLTVTNTIVANSTLGENCAGTAVTDGGHNLDSDGTCGVGPATDPLLAPAGQQNNGGPTQTIALLAGSPAIDAGDETICSAPFVNNVDQRGYGRPGTGYTNCSIGAYEFNSPGPPPTCTGDCNSNGRVAINELVLGVNIVLGVQPVAACPAFANSEGMVDIAQLTKGVSNGLSGCGG